MLALKMYQKHDVMYSFMKMQVGAQGSMFTALDHLPGENPGVVNPGLEWEESMAADEVKSAIEVFLCMFIYL